MISIKACGYLIRVAGKHIVSHNAENIFDTISFLKLLREICWAAQGFYIENEMHDQYRLAANIEHAITQVVISYEQ